MNLFERDAFIASLGFGVDDFQIEAFDAWDGGNNVLVSAPTGSGKTLVATYAIEDVLAQGARAFYTTPLKALSNQKYRELVDRYGEDRVGLLTGDTSINRNGDVIVMTTEVLRNMLLADSHYIPNVSLVIMDEVHYLQDPFRGGVWEEVLILTPRHVRFVALSATISNARVLGEWLEEVRGPTRVVVEEHRPIELHHHVVAQRRGQDRPELVNLLNGGRLSEAAKKIDNSMLATKKFRTRSQWHGPKSSQPPAPYSTPRRSEILRVLENEDLLPAITFIFSRAACDDAVRQCLRDGLRFTTSDQRARISEIAFDKVRHFRDEDLTALGFDQFVGSLGAGIAAHHAGMIPTFREIVEDCFTEGLLFAVFATETLALGINMPARSVVIERFTKYSDAGRAHLNSGEFAQLTGRAGRRGLDDEGHAVVVFNSDTTLMEIARVAVAPPPDLHSSFRPTYNLTTNLLHHFDRETSIEILQRSYAQFEVDRRHHLSRRSLTEHLLARVAVLTDLGYADGWGLTDAGESLRAVYHESDLLITECWRQGLFSDCEPATLAAIVSSFIYEGKRSRTTPAPKGSDRKKRSNDRLGPVRRESISERTNEARLIALQVIDVEAQHHVRHARTPDGTLGAAMAAWTRGAPLGTVLDIADAEVGTLSPGDFVRHAKQVADLGEQIGILSQRAGDTATFEAVQVMLEGVIRSVVAGPSSMHHRG